MDSNKQLEIILSKTLILAQLSTNISALRGSPPLGATYCAILRFLYTFPNSTIPKIASVLPCTMECLRQTISRLSRFGYIHSTPVPTNGKIRRQYSLTPAAKATVAMWHKDIINTLNKLQSLQKTHDS